MRLFWHTEHRAHHAGTSRNCTWNHVHHGVWMCTSGMCAHPHVCTRHSTICSPATLRQVTYLGQKYTCVCKNDFLFLFVLNESLLSKRHSTAKLWRKNRQFERAQHTQGACQAAWWTPLPIHGLITPRPRQDVRQQWPVRAQRGIDRCFGFRALLQGEERH